MVLSLTFRVLLDVLPMARAPEAAETVALLATVVVAEEVLLPYAKPLSPITLLTAVAPAVELMVTLPEPVMLAVPLLPELPIVIPLVASAAFHETGP